MYRFRRKAYLAKEDFAFQINRYSSGNVMMWSYNNTTAPAAVPTTGNGDQFQRSTDFPQRAVGRTCEVAVGRCIPDALTKMLSRN